MEINPYKHANPAEAAAEEAIRQVFQAILCRNNFRLEAGAGAGKTYSLVQTLKFILEKNQIELLRKDQQVACISYTNVATDEIKLRTNRHPVIFSSTIHSFCWSLIKDFQPHLRQQIANLNSWKERLESVDNINLWRITYDLGYRKVNSDEYALSLGHDDVLELTVSFMEEKKFRAIFSSRFPVLLIDEYQDTNSAFANSIIKHFIDTCTGPLIGLFGDSWQKIYGDGCGLINHDNLKFIGKEANFRSVKPIVDVLNRMRLELPQEVQDPESTGYVGVFHSNSWNGLRREGSHWKGDLPEEIAHKYLEFTCKLLEDSGWDFSHGKTKILMLTHNLLASELSYSGIAKVFRFNESFIKKEDPYIAFFIDTLEPMCTAFQSGNFGKVFSVLGQSIVINTPKDKQKWSDYLNNLLRIRKEKTIGEMIEFLRTDSRAQLSDAIVKIENQLEQANQEQIEESELLNQTKNLKEVPYEEVVNLSHYLDKHSPFSTKHGVKGAEFENVLIVFGRGWNHYNWNKYLELVQSTNIPPSEMNFFERNRNLFYVTCSRPKKRLALLFTQYLSVLSLKTLSNWFGNDVVYPLSLE